METRASALSSPDDMDFGAHSRNLQCPISGTSFGAYGAETPLDDRDHPFTEDLDRADPWQFKNFRVT